MSQILGFLSAVPLAEQHPKGTDLLYEKLDEALVLMLDSISVINKYAVKERARK